ncbi:hypothetical protein AB3N60_11225 [Leptospira sp. WS39.C2]
MTSKVFKLSRGKESSTTFNELKSMEFDTTNSQNVSLKLKGISSDNENLEICTDYGYSYYRCNSNLNWNNVELKEVEPLGGIISMYHNLMFVNKDLRKIYGRGFRFHKYRSEFYSTIDEKAFLIKNGLDEVSHCHNYLDCKSYKRQEYSKKLEMIEPKNVYYIYIIDQKENIIKMYSFTFSNLNENKNIRNIYIISPIKKQNRIKTYYLLIPFSLLGDIITSPLQLILYFDDLINGIGALGALG